MNGSQKMKRSEMVRAIERVLADVRMESSQSRADRVLKIIEYKGMLPPVMEGIYDPVPTVTPTGNLDYGWKRGWEPEDEQT